MLSAHEAMEPMARVIEVIWCAALYVTIHLWYTIKARPSARNRCSRLAVKALAELAYLIHCRLRTQGRHLCSGVRVVHLRIVAISAFCVRVGSFCVKPNNSQKTKWLADRRHSQSVH